MAQGIKVATSLLLRSRTRTRTREAKKEGRPDNDIIIAWRRLVAHLRHDFDHIVSWLTWAWFNRHVRKPCITDVGRNYPIRIDVHHRKNAGCIADAETRWVGWLHIALLPLEMEYWRWLPEDASRIITRVLEELEQAGYADDRADSVGAVASDLSHALGAFVHLLDEPAYELRDEQNRWDGPLHATSDAEIRRLHTWLAAHTTCDARLTLSKSWHW